MSITFQFKEEKSPVFGTIRRPIAEVYLKHRQKNIWQPVTMLVDTGADYTLLPRFLASPLGVYFSHDCRSIHTLGVGGNCQVYLLTKSIKAKIGLYERTIPLGFVNSDSIPPLLGRQEFFETFKVIFEKFYVTFE